MAFGETGAGVQGKLWATFIPAELPKEEGQQPRGVSLLMRDFQSVALYDTNGAFMGVRRPGSGKPIQARICVGLGFRVWGFRHSVVK